LLWRGGAICVEDLVAVDEVADLLKRMIKVKSIKSQETRVAEIIIDVLESEGIYSYELIESSPGRGNLVISLRGKRGEGFNLMIIGHLDVVPPGDGWSVNPFGGVEKNGYIYGGGAIDDKGQIAAMTYLAVLLHRINYDFKGTVRLLMVADEETQDPRHGIRYLIRERRDLFKRVDGAIGELGGLVNIMGEKRQLLIYGEKGAVTLRIRAQGDKGHASQTYKINNAVKNIAGITLRIPDDFFFISEPVRMMLKDLLGAKSFLLTNRFLNKIVLRGIRDLWAARFLHALTHVTIAKTVIHGGEAENVYPGEAELLLDIRFFPEQNDLEEIMRIIKKSIGKYEYTIEKKNYMPSTYSPRNTVLYKAVEKTIIDLGRKPLPLIQVGSSDSAWIRSLGIPTYHFMTTSKSIELGKVHGADERIWKKRSDRNHKGILAINKELRSLLN